MTSFYSIGLSVLSALATYIIVNNLFLPFIVLITLTVTFMLINSASVNNQQTTTKHPTKLKVH